jgi:chromosome partitioning protein
MIVAIANQQCSTEASPVADQLAMMRAGEGCSVLLINGDSGHSAAARNDHRIRSEVPTRSISGKGMQPELENLSPRYHDIVIDTEGRDSMGSRSALAAASVAVIAVQPAHLDAGLIAKLIERIAMARESNAHLRVLFVLTGVRAEPDAHEMARVNELVAQVPDARLANTVIHAQNMLHDGVTFDHWPDDAKAGGEMSALYREVFKT